MKFYVKGRNIANHSETKYEVADGAVLVDNYNETLDSATIRLSNLASEIHIEPFDECAIVFDDGTKKTYCVDSYRRDMACVQPPLYTYTIELFSETKALEGVQLPSLAITKLMGGKPRKVSYYLNLYLSLYSPMMSSSPQNGAVLPKYSLTSEALQRFSKVECPEFQWNAPNLREVITDLMMADDCIPVVSNSQVGFIDISQRGSEATSQQKSFLSRVSVSQSSDDYVSEIRMNAVNSANNTEISYGSPYDATAIVERIGFRNDESYLLTTDQIELRTAFPIWRLYSFHIIMKVTYKATFWSTQAGISPETITRTITIPMDLLDYTLEHGVWRTKPIYYSSFSAGHGISAEYQNTCLYYVRGERNVRNFNGKQSNQLLFIPNQATVFELITNSQEVEDACEADANNNKPQQHAGTWQLHDLSITSRPSYKDVEFLLKYDALDEFVFQASKGDTPRNRRVVIDHQANSYVDTKALGMLEYLKANRLGNKMASINGRYPVGSSIPGLAQTIGGKVIFRRELAYHRGYVEANFEATDNYVLRDYFTGVKAKRRSWRVVEGKEALVRKDLVKFYVNSKIKSVENAIRVIPSYASLDEYIGRFMYCAARFRTAEGDILPQAAKYNGSYTVTNAVMLEFTKRKVGNSVVFTVRLPDNAFAGRYISSYSSGISGADVTQEPIKYTDDNGEFTEMTLYFYSDIDAEMYPTDETKRRAVKPMCYAPEYDTYGSKYLVAQIPIRVYKDNKEIPQISIQFELNEEADDIFLGKTSFDD